MGREVSAWGRCEGGTARPRCCRLLFRVRGGPSHNQSSPDEAARFVAALPARSQGFGRARAGQHPPSRPTHLAGRARCVAEPAGRVPPAFCGVARHRSKRGPCGCQGCTGAAAACRSQGGTRPLSCVPQRAQMAQLRPSLVCSANSEPPAAPDRRHAVGRRPPVLRLLPGCLWRSRPGRVAARRLARRLGLSCCCGIEVHVATVLVVCIGLVRNPLAARHRGCGCGDPRGGGAWGCAPRGANGHLGTAHLAQGGCRHRAVCLMLPLLTVLRLAPAAG